MTLKTVSGLATGSGAASRRPGAASCIHYGVMLYHDHRMVYGLVERFQWILLPISRDDMYRVSAHTCVCKYSSKFACMHSRVYTCMDGWMDGWMDACMHGCMHGCMYINCYIFMCVFMYACMYACMHVCMHMCMYVCLSMRGLSTSQAVGQNFPSKETIG